MKNQNTTITKENLIRIKSEKILCKLNEVYKTFYKPCNVSKNNFFNTVIKIGIDVLEKQEKDNWTLKNEKQTLLDAIHEHTKRMNYFIKFSKPFIKNTYANVEILQEMLRQMYNYFLLKMDRTEKEYFENHFESYFNKLSNKLEESKQRMFDYYDYEVEMNQKNEKKQRKLEEAG